MTTEWLLLLMMLVASSQSDDSQAASDEVIQELLTEIDMEGIHDKQQQISERLQQPCEDSYFFENTDRSLGTWYRVISMLAFTGKSLCGLLGLLLSDVMLIYNTCANM